MDISILSEPKIITSIVAFSVATTQLIKPMVKTNRAITLPIISTLLGIVASFVVAYTPKDLIPLLAALVSGSTGSGGFGVVKEIITPKEEVLEAPVTFND